MNLASRALVVAALFAVEVAAQPAGGYRAVAGWAKLPAGRSWGAVMIKYERIR